MVKFKFPRLTIEDAKTYLAFFLPSVYVVGLTYRFMIGQLASDAYIGAVGLPIVGVILIALFKRREEAEEEEEETPKPTPTMTNGGSSVKKKKKKKSNPFWDELASVF